jgi:phosphonopyruvate decarboxylase
MIQPESFYKELYEHGIQFYAGVPDSLMKGFLSYLNASKEISHHITVNEGAAVALGTGYHLATGKLPLIYLQNSGLGNIVNPITSLADSEVYGIPMLLLIGWRGEPGFKDEPQHMKMGRITLPMLDILNIPYWLLKNEESSSWKEKICNAVKIANGEQKPVALVVSKDFFDDMSQSETNIYELTSVDVIDALYKKLTGDTVVVCTTGKIGRTYYERWKRGILPHNYLLNVGAMGYASSIATGLKLHSAKHVLVLDGDGSFLMHMGTVTMPGQLIANDFTYLLLNNGAHESVGGQQTVGLEVDLCSIAKAAGFENVHSISTRSELENWIESDWKSKKQFVEIKINTNVPAGLPRPELLPKIEKILLLEFLRLQSF